jgi:hypothetical protein
MLPIGERGISNAGRVIWSRLDEDRMAEGEKVSTKPLRRRWTASSGAERVRDHSTLDDCCRRRKVGPRPTPGQPARGMPRRRIDVAGVARPVCSHPPDRGQDCEALSGGYPPARHER